MRLINRTISQLGILSFLASVIVVNILIIKVLVDQDSPFENKNSTAGKGITSRIRNHKIGGPGAGFQLAYKSKIKDQLKIRQHKNDATSATPKVSEGSAFQNMKIRKFQGQKKVESYGTKSNKIDSGSETNDVVLSITNHCKRWAVITTILYPTEAIVRVTEMQSWCLVIVPDEKTPHDYMEKLEKLQRERRRQQKYEDKDSKGRVILTGKKKKDNALQQNVYFFSLEKQRQWSQEKGPFGSFVATVPWNQLYRKNIGYLFAILHGAEFIFDFDDQNYVKLDDKGIPLNILPVSNKKQNGKLKLKDVNIIMQGSNAFNPHPFMMGASIDGSWARGFPLELVQNKYTQGQVAYQRDVHFETNSKKIGVIQFLADGNPDIDAIHRLLKPLPTTLEFTNAKSVLVPTHSYAPYNAQATIHTTHALWATLLPITVPKRVSDIWRSYFAQCIFADAGIQLIFSPSKIFQEQSIHSNYLEDFNAEQDLYNKSGALVDFLSKWDSEYTTIPERMEQLWIDLYEYGYIEVEDVYSVQAWLGALIQIGYNFPAMKPRFRNVAVMGQFNYAPDSSSAINDVIFWAQKNLERFHTVIVAGPFSAEQVQILKANSIEAISNHNDTEFYSKNITEAGYYTPLENLKNTLLFFKDSETIDGVLYAHDDAIMNITELTNGKYPFPSEKFISDRFFHMRKKTLSVKEKRTYANIFTYRIFPDGHLENFLKGRSFSSIIEMYHKQPLAQWSHTIDRYCGPGQTELAKDPDSAIYREEDGSILFSSFLQSDALFVPTKYAEEFARAAELHLKHRIWIECSMNTIMDMVERQANAKHRSVMLCTDWTSDRGTYAAVEKCWKDINITYGFIHPYKIGKEGRMRYDEVYEMLQ